MATATTPPTIQPDTRRLTEDDPDYLRLHATTVRRLEASIATFVRELHAARGNTQRESEAASRFVERHTGELRRAYEAAHTEGVRDYYGAVSGSRHMPYVAPDADRERQLLAFYAPSVARMAAEALRTLHESRREALGEPDDAGAIRLGYPDQPRQKGKYASTGWTRPLKGRPEHGQQEEKGQGGGTGTGRGGSAKEPAAGGARRTTAAPRKTKAPTAADQAKAEGMHQEAVGTRGGGGKAAAAKPHGGLDDHEQQMPFTHEEFHQALASVRESEPLGGRTAETHSATINGREYIIKEPYEGYARDIHSSPGAMAAHEVAAHNIAHAAGLDEFVPHETYHLSEDRIGGAHYSVQSREPGQAAATLKGGDRRALERQLAADPRHALFDYVVGGLDRHDGNIIYDAKSGKITHIDFSNDFYHSAHYNDSLNNYTHAVLTDAGQKSPRSVPLSHEALHQFTSRADAIETAARTHSGLTSEEVAGVRARLSAIREVEKMAHPTLANLMRESEQADRGMRGLPRFEAGERDQARATIEALRNDAGVQQRRRGLFGRLFGRGR